MKIASICLVAAIPSALAGCAAQNTPLEAGLRSESAYTRQAKPGETIKLYAAYQVSPECVMYGAAPAVTIVSLPQHGVATVVHTTGHTSYPVTNPRYKCNSRMTPITGVLYQPKPGFVGTDTVKLHADFHESLDNPSEDVVATIKVGS